MFAKPFRRRADLDAFDVRCNVSGAQSCILNMYRYIDTFWLKRHFLPQRVTFHRYLQNRRKLPRDPTMREAIVPTVWRHFYIEDVVLYTFDLKCVECQRIGKSDRIRQRLVEISLQPFTRYFHI